MPKFGSLNHCKAGKYTIMVRGKNYTFELIDISKKNYGYSYFEIRLNGHKIGNHQCQSEDCEAVIRKKIAKWLKKPFVFR